MPTPSCPGTNGGEGLTGQSPWAAWMSVWHSPRASTLTRTWPAMRGAAATCSTTSGSPKSWTTAARYVLACVSLAPFVGSTVRGAMVVVDMRISCSNSVV